MSRAAERAPTVWRSLAGAFRCWAWSIWSMCLALLSATPTGGNGLWQCWRSMEGKALAASESNWTLALLLSLLKAHGFKKAERRSASLQSDLHADTLQGKVWGVGRVFEGAGHLHSLPKRAVFHSVLEDCLVDMVWNCYVRLNVLHPLAFVCHGILPWRER